MCIIIFPIRISKWQGWENLRIGKTFFTFFSVCRLWPPHHHHHHGFQIKQFFFLFLKKQSGTALTRTGANPERMLSYGKRRLRAKQESKKQKGKTVDYSLIKAKLKQLDVSITSQKRHKVVLCQDLFEQKHKRVILTQAVTA